MKRYPACPHMAVLTRTRRLRTVLIGLLALAVLGGCLPEIGEETAERPVFFGELEAKLLASDRATGDLFGSSAAISGDYAVVGATSRDGLAMDNGAAYVFQRLSGNTWGSETLLTIPIADSPAASDAFGTSVAISGNLIAVGAPSRDEGAADTGAVYTYIRTGGNTWSGPTKLILPVAPSGLDTYGLSVSIDGDYLVVGATLPSGSGGAFAYRHLGGNTWSAAYSLPPIVYASAQFGRSVSISGDRIVVGEIFYATGGAAVVFERTGTNTWDGGTTLLASDFSGSDGFGGAVGIGGDYVIVGARSQNSGGASRGAAYVYQRLGLGSWGNEAKLIAPDGVDNDQLGCAVALKGDLAIVTTFLAGGGTGSVYAFNRTSGNTWVFRQKFPALDISLGDQFGSGLGLSDTAEVIVGARFQADPLLSITQSGAAYILR